MSEVVRQSWEAHQAMSFPAGMGGTEVNGIDLVMLDADIAGLVISHLGHAPVDRRLLAQLVADAGSVLPALSGEAAEYFGLLRTLALTVQGELDSVA